jgi:hypothetical protein
MCYLTRSCDIYPRDLVTCYAASDVISPSGPRVSFRHAEEQISLLVHTPQHTPTEYLKTPFESPNHGMTVDVLKESFGSSD